MALPDIAFLRFFTRLAWPSMMPEFQDGVEPAVTASGFWRREVAKPCIGLGRALGPATVPYFLRIAFLSLRHSLAMDIGHRSAGEDIDLIW